MDNHLRENIEPPRLGVRILFALACTTAIVAGACGGAGTAKSPTAASGAASSDASPPTSVSTPTPWPATPFPTATPTPVPPPTPVPTPIALSGNGQQATDPVKLGTGVFVATFKYQGARNFIVNAFDSKGGKSLLVNKIGVYSGGHLLLGPETYTFDIQASGPWTVDIRPISVQFARDTTGAGDTVSGLFIAPAGPAAFAFSHTGQSNFIVKLDCDKGTSLVENEIGAVSGSRVVSFPVGSSVCFWEVTADGEWSITAK